MNREQGPVACISSSERVLIADHATLERRSSIAQNVAWNYVGAIYEALAGLVLVSYIVRHVSVAEYGLFLLALSVSAILSLFDFGLANLLVQAYVAAAHEDARNLSSLLSTAFVALAGIGVVGVVVSIALALSLPGPFHIPPIYIKEAAIVFVLVGVAAQAALPNIALDFAYQAFHRFDRLNQAQLVTATVRLVLTILLLARGYGVISLAIVQVAVTFLRLLLLYLALPSSVPGAGLDVRQFHWPLLRPLLRPGGWAFLDNAMRQLATSSDAFILGVFSSVTGVALFGIGSKLPAQLSNMVMRGAVVILPSLSKHHTQKNLPELQRVYLDAQKWVFTGALPVVVLGSVCAGPIILLWAGSAYLGAATVMQWLLLASLSVALEYSSDLLLYSRGQVRTAARIATCESVANIAVSLALVFRYGAVGLAAGTAITHIVINAFWYTPAACKAADLHPLDLIRAVLSGHTRVLLLLLVIEVILLRVLSTMLPPFELLAAGIFAGILYMSLWGVKMGLPMWRLRIEAGD